MTYFFALWPWYGFFQAHQHNFFTSFSAAFASGLILLFCFYFPKVLEIGRKDFDLNRKTGFLLIAFVQLIPLLIHFPGLVSYDDINLLGNLENGSPSGFHSFSYSVWAQASGFLFLSYLRISFLNFILLLFISFMSFRLLPKKASPWFLAALTLLFICPQTSVLVLFQNRDSLNSLLVLWLVLGLVAQKGPAQRDPWFRPSTLLGLTIFLGDLRQEGKLFVFFVPLILWWIHRPPREDLLRSICVILLGGLVWFGGPRTFFEVNPYAPEYLATTLINPLSYVLHEKGLSEATPEEIDQMNRFFNVPYLIDYYDPLDIKPFFYGGIRSGVVKEDFLAFDSAAKGILLRNIPLWLENRKEMALTALNFKGYPLGFADHLRDFQPELLPLLARANLPSKTTPNFWEDLHLKFLYNLFFKLPWPLRILYSSCLLPLMALFFLVFIGRPQFLFPSLLILIRTLVVVLAMPGAYFKYIGSAWVAGWLLFILWIALKKGADEGTHG